MGWFGKLFGKSGPRKPPAWARESFGTDGAKFDAFVDVVLEVLAAAGHAASEMDVRTGSVLLSSGEWVFEGAATNCAQAAPSQWPALVQQSLARQGGQAEDDDDGEEEAEQAPRLASGGGKAWIIGAAPWGVVFECGAQAMVLVLLPTIDVAVVPTLPEGLVKRVIVCNGSDAGHLAGTAIARAAGLAHVFATHPDRPVDRGGAAVTAKRIEIRPLTTVKEGTLTVALRGTCVYGTWQDGVTFLASDAIPMSQLVETAPSYAVGKLVVDEYDAAKFIDVALKMRKLLIVANTPGVDARHLAETLAQIGISSEILDADPNDGPKVPRISEVLAHMVMGDLDRADAIAAESIAAGDRVDEMHHQRAMIALMRGDETAADVELAQINTPKALSSRAIIAAKRGDHVGRDYAKRAVAQLPGDAIAIRAAVSVHALTGDPEGARAVLAEHGHHLAAGVREALDSAIDDPEALQQSVAHRFPEHAAMVLEAVAPIVTAGDFAQAEMLLRRASGWDPDNIGIVGELGFALSQQNKDDEAVAIYDTAIERGGAHDLLRFNRANCLLRRRSFTQAAADLRVCLALKPDWHEARVNLTSALFGAGDAKGAKAEVAQLEKLGGPPQHIHALRQMLAGTR